MSIGLNISRANYTTRKTAEQRNYRCAGRRTDGSTRPRPHKSDVSLSAPANSLPKRTRTALKIPASYLGGTGFRTQSGGRLPFAVFLSPSQQTSVGTATITASFHVLPNSPLSSDATHSTLAVAVSKSQTNKQRNKAQVHSGITCMGAYAQLLYDKGTAVKELSEK
jgi:hypothetical protein